VLGRTVAGCGVRLIWIGLNPGDELREASCRDGGMDYKQVGLNSHQVDIGEVLVGVVAEFFLHDRRIDGKASGGANADRVTVRCGLRDADYASGAHPIFDQRTSLAIGSFYEYAPSTKAQNEENRAVMGRELLWAVCGFKNEAVGTPLGACEGQST
jgi:hypothetical protein